MANLGEPYPEIEPYESGLLAVGDGHELYWETSGNPDGKPAVFLHGGPGGGSKPDNRRLFDPARYRIVVFDQRGCGRSRPHASQPGADLSTNTTWHLVADIEALREHLGIQRWLVLGGSWGSTLALAYAETHPDRVTELILRGVFTLRRHELDWFYQGGAAAIFPERWQGFLAPVAPEDRGDLMSAYHRLLNDPDPAVHGRAAVAWSVWEASTVTLIEDPDLLEAYEDPAFSLAFARIENHFFVNNGWLDEGQLIANASVLQNIRGIIVQGRYDMCTPPITAWDLHQAWPTAELLMVPATGHSATEPGNTRCLVLATDEFADRSSDSG
ncbi:MAG: prolyl aminopeptidase [Geodermatophilaceae bacterium]